MENEKRLIDANKVFERADEVTFMGFRAEERKKHFMDLVSEILRQPPVDAVEVPDKELLKVINLLIKQYEHSKRSDYVYNPIAHAFYHTWKQLDESGYGERKDNG